jgi:hypothetical protein
MPRALWQLPLEDPIGHRGAEPMIAFGPVPSRRSGRSLGIKNIPPKQDVHVLLCLLPARTHQQCAGGAPSFLQAIGNRRLLGESATIHGLPIHPHASAGGNISTCC